MSDYYTAQRTQKLFDLNEDKTFRHHQPDPAGGAKKKAKKGRMSL